MFQTVPSENRNCWTGLYWLAALFSAKKPLMVILSVVPEMETSRPAVAPNQLSLTCLSTRSVGNTPVLNCSVLSLVALPSPV